MGMGVVLGRGSPSRSQEVLAKGRTGRGLTERWVIAKGGTFVETTDWAGPHGGEGQTQERAGSWCLNTGGPSRRKRESLGGALRRSVAQL